MIFDNISDEEATPMLFSIFSGVSESKSIDGEELIATAAFTLTLLKNAGVLDNEMTLEYLDLMRKKLRPWIDSTRNRAN